MIIACPKCNVGFFVAPEKIGVSGRRVKCSKCKHIWHVTVNQSMLEKSNNIIAERINEPIPPGANLPAIIPLKISQLLYVLPALLVLLNLITFWVLYPNITKKLGICGKMCTEERVSIEDINYEFDPQTHKVVIDYIVVNSSVKPVQVPLVQVKLLDNHKNNLKTIYSEDSNVMIDGLGSTKIRAAFSSIPDQAEIIQLALGNKMKFWFY